MMSDEPLRTDEANVSLMPDGDGERLVREADATVVAMLREAGPVVVGKTNPHELAVGVTSNKWEFGAVNNPVDPRLSTSEIVIGPRHHRLDRPRSVR